MGSVAYAIVGKVLPVTKISASVARKATRNKMICRTFPNPFGSCVPSLLQPISKSKASQFIIEVIFFVFINPMEPLQFLGRQFIIVTNIIIENLSSYHLHFSFAGISEI